jgi:hypothetical protein
MPAKLAWRARKAGSIPAQSPTWSWLSTFQPVSTWAADASNQPLSPELLSWSIQLVDESSTFGHVLGGELEFMATVTHSSKVSREIAGKIKIQIDWEASGEKSLDDLKYVGDLYYYLYIGLASTKVAVKSLENTAYMP